MNKKIHTILTFIVSFIIAYLIIGFFINGIFVGIKWSEGVTIYDKLMEYYIRTASINIIPTFIIAIISTSVVEFKTKK